jgi:hypothetical protein
VNGGVYQVSLKRAGTVNDAGEDEIAHDQRLIPLGSKGEPGAERQRRLQLHAIEHDLEIGARKANAVDTAGHLRAGFAEGLANLTPVTFNREGRGGQASSAFHRCPRKKSSNSLCCR